MTTQKQAMGQWGEETAAAYLEDHGYTILGRNFHTAHGEIDIVASKASLLIFVEVKTRSSHAFAYPEDSVTRRKQAHLLSAAADYLQAHPESGESWQFDMIAIERKAGRSPEIVHFENVIS
ncbi:MAG: YraN family protein [Anaerolineales bacterium]|jgi:putative endonuclease